MRNYFDLKIRGGSIALYVIAGWAAFLMLSLIYSFYLVLPAAADPVLDGTYLGYSLIRLLWAFCIAVVGYGVLFCIVKATVGGLSLNGERFYTDYDFKKYAIMCVKGLLLSLVTLCIYLPWFVVKIIRFFAAGTDFRGNKLEFKGDGMTLFSYVALLILLPLFFSVFLIVIALVAKSVPFIIILGVVYLLCFSVYYAMMLKWIMNFSYGAKRIVSKVRGVQFGLFIAGQILLSAITIGLYYPMALLRLWKYYVGSIVLGDDMVEEKLGFSMMPGKNYFTILGQMLLVIITIGIYYPWAYVKIIGLLMNQTYVDVIEKPTEKM